MQIANLRDEKSVEMSDEAYCFITLVINTSVFMGTIAPSDKSCIQGVNDDTNCFITELNNDYKLRDIVNLSNHYIQWEGVTSTISRV